MGEVARISGLVLEQLHYIHLPTDMNDADVAAMEAQISAWSRLPVDLHVLDFKNLNRVPERFYRAVQAFHGLVKDGQLVSLNLGEALRGEVSRRRLETAFRPVASTDDLTPQRTLSADELKRLYIRYLIRAAFAAVEVSLNSTVSCDENYLAKIERVPWDEFDLVSVLDVRGEFLPSQLRLCATTEVLGRLAQRMLGPTVTIGPEMIESMTLELLNLVYGQAKSQLNDQESFRLPSAIPRLLPLAEFRSLERTAERVSILPLVTPMGAFYVEVELK